VSLYHWHAVITNGKGVFLSDDHAHLSYLLFKLHMTYTDRVTESIYEVIII